MRSLILRFGLWLVAWAQRPIVDSVEAAVYRAMAHVGVSVEHFSLDQDLTSVSHKIHAILHHAAEELGKNHQLHTVGDLVKRLREAPKW